MSAFGLRALAPLRCESLNISFSPITRPLETLTMNKFKRIGLILTALTFISGCSTWSGFGQDLQKLGRKIEKQGDKDK